MFQLRPYQAEAKQAILAAWDEGYRKTLLVLPTGCGKTVVFSSVTEDQVKKGHRVLIMAHRGELLDQAADKLRSASGLDSVLEKAESSCLGSPLPVTVGSVQSLAQEKRLARFPNDYFQDIIVDEAHHCLSDSYRRVLDHFPDANILGVTATPDRGDMKNLGEFFDSKAYEYSMTEAIRQGYLCPIKAQMIPLELDINSVGISNGDFAVGEIGHALEPYLEQIAQEMVNYCKGRKTVVFLPLIATSQKFCAMLNAAGLRAAEVNGNSGDRAEVLSDFENGKQIYRLTVAKNDISEYSIVVPEGYTDEKNAYYSAEILQHYISVATGIELPILNDGTVPEKAIVIHDVDRRSELGEKLGSEGYKYDVTDGVLNIYGTYRGNMYAVYEILESYLGFRFYDHFYVFLYKHRTVDIPEGTSVELLPEIKFRFCRQNVAYGGTNYYFPMRQNGSQIIGYDEERYGWKYGPNVYNAHSYAYYWKYGTGIMPPDDGTMTLEERYVAKYESGEFKDYLTWQPCASNDTVYNTLFTGMLDHLARMENWGKDCYAFTTIAKHLVEEGEKSVSFSINDNENYCTCRFCNLKANGKKDSKTGEWTTLPEGYSGLYVKLANRAARDIQEFYPGMRVHTILYNHAIPSTVKPDKNLIVFYCGQGCNNHYINSGECTGLGQLGKESNNFTAESLKAWGELCAETGAEMWYWYYGVTYYFYLVSLPCVFNIYYDYKFLFEECNVKGIYYERLNNLCYNFENLKAYMSVKMDWEPHMTYEQYIEYMKEFLYMYYGPGYEKVYEFIEMENTAGDECGTCFVSNFDRPGDMYSYAYID